MTVNETNTYTEVTYVKKRLRRAKWTVTLTHLPSGIIGTGVDARSYEEARAGAVARIESLLQARQDRS